MCIAGVKINTGPLAHEFPVGPVESVLHWPNWPVKF